MDNKIVLSKVTVTLKPITRTIKDKVMILMMKSEKNIDEKTIKKLEELEDKVVLNEDWTVSDKNDKKLIKEYNKAFDNFTSEKLMNLYPYSNELKDLLIQSICDNETGNDARDIFDFLEDPILIDDKDNIQLIMGLINYNFQYWKIDKKK